MSGLKRNAGLAAAAALVATGFVAAWPTAAPAAQLDEKTCAQLKLEIGQLEGLGVRDNLAKGAQWGKANLRASQLEQVKKLIEMDETVAFRCPKAKPVVADSAAKAKAPGKVVAKVLPKVPTPKNALEPAPSGTPPVQKAQAKPKPAVTAGGTAPAPSVQPAAKPKPRPPASATPAPQQ